MRQSEKERDGNKKRCKERINYFLCVQPVCESLLHSVAFQLTLICFCLHAAFLCRCFQPQLWRQGHILMCGLQNEKLYTSYHEYVLCITEIDFIWCMCVCDLFFLCLLLSSSSSFTSSRLWGESRHARSGVNGDVHLPDSHSCGPEWYSRGTVS